MIANFRFRLYVLSASFTISIEFDLTNLSSTIVSVAVVLSVKDDANLLTLLGFSNSISIFPYILCAIYDEL